MTPLLAYLGHHKCGSVWTTEIVMDVCKLLDLGVGHHHGEELFCGDIAAARARDGFDFWCYTNADVNFVRDVEVRGFHVVRDPRDVIVSGYFSHLCSHPVWPRLRSYRPYLQTLSKRDGLLAEIEFSGYFLFNMLIWDYSRPEILEVRFEDLVTCPETGFEEIFRFLNLVPERLSLEQLREIVDGRSFIKRSGGRPPGVEDPASHFRKGVPGDWRNHFEPVHCEYFKKLYNPLLLKLGYETREDW